MDRSPADILQADISYLKGIGPARADLLKAELGIYKAQDLLFDFPVKHIDRSSFQRISDIHEEGQYVQLIGQLTHFGLAGAGRARRMRGVFKDESGTLEMVWFKGIRYLERYLKLDTDYIAYGRITYFNRTPTIAHPELEIFSADALHREQVSRIFPVYRSTEQLNLKGLDGKARRKIMAQLLERIDERVIPEYLPAYLVKKLRFPSAYETLRNIHFPDSQEILLVAEKRLKFEELFFHQLKLLHSQHLRKEQTKSYVFGQVGEQFHTFYNEHLPFELTEAQKRVLREIRRDLGIGIQMNRLLQGDVGSGKTIVALLAMLMAWDNGFQSCLMAPTEILAQQHFHSISSLLEPMGIRIGFLTGSIKGKARKLLLEQLERGELAMVVGTHALLEDPVRFKSLGLAITDEQHRFGVAQRARLWKKGIPHPPHILVMTATPIPRTLAMTLYGDLDVSVIDELPPGRKPVKTIFKSELYRPQLIGFMKTQIAEGRQIYVVYPLIEESEKVDLEDLNNGYEALLQHFPMPQYQISVVHGRMKQEDKDWEMQRFLDRTTQIMVATTVIEVGVNVPNASVMIIENSERFGLSQLHQLRGRVGRGAAQSYCVLMTSYKLSREARERLNTMCRTNNGFEIAEVDLKLRGPGAIEGTQQSGLPGFRIANLAQDGAILSAARQIVQEILTNDPELSDPAHTSLKRHIRGELREVMRWSKIS